MPRPTSPLAALDDQIASPRRRSIWRWWPVLALVAVAIAAHLTGLDQHLSLAEVARNRDALKAFAADRWLLAVLGYFALYFAMTIASLPVAAVLSIAGGFLFGWWVSAPVSVLAATSGATVVFHIVRTTLGRTLAERVGPAAARFQKGFADDAFNYLLALRLLPLVPFFLVNAVAGLCRVKAWTFVTATVLGIIPGALAYAWLGSGLDSVIMAQKRAQAACLAAKVATECPLQLNPLALLTPQLAIAFVGLAAVALLPLAVRHFRNRPAP